MQRPRSETVTLNDILITEELSQRSPRSPNLQAENRAMRTLVQQMVNVPEIMLQSLVDVAVELCQAGTAGVSLLETTTDGEEVFRWTVLAGTLKQYVGGTTPRNSSPCGVCLDGLQPGGAVGPRPGEAVRGTPVLFSHPERYFTYFQEANTSIVEGLVIPLIADDHALGTIWIMSHDQQRHFDLEDVRIMTSLADFTAAALLLNQRQTGELLATNAALETEIAERKQVEEKLRGVQKRLELSLTGANLGVWTYNVGTDQFWADDRAKQMHGHELHEVHTFAEAGVNIHPEDRDHAQAAFAQAIQDCSKLQIEYRVVWPDGSVHGIASYAESIPTGDSLRDGKAEQDEGTFYGVVQDISDRLRVEGDRKRAEAALQESEARSRALIENLPGGAAFVVDHDLRYLLAEGEALSAAGFKPEDLVGQTIFQVLPPELAAYYEGFYRQALAGEPFEHEHDAHDHSYISRGTPLRSSNGEIYAALAVSYDISDHKQAEAALRESEARLRVAIKAANLGTWELDLTTRTLTASNLCKENLGLLPTADLSYQRLFELIHPEDRNRVRAAVRRAIVERIDYITEYRVICPDTSLRWILARGRTFYDNDTPLRLIGVTQDITERKRAEAQHIQLIREQAARFEAEQASQMKDEFLAMVSHELQSPLVAVLGWTRLLRTNPPSYSTLIKALHTIERNATLQAKLIQDLLDISRITVGKLQLSLQPVELKSVIEAAIAAVMTAAIAKGIHLQYELECQSGASDRLHRTEGESETSVFVLGDRDRLQQIICNLLTNAIKFTPESGSVTVQLSVKDDPSHTKICIMDTGIGISAEFLPHVFDRFRQAEKSGSAGGLGLGLAIARQLVELHGGTITAKSSGIGQGTTFTIKLPLMDTRMDTSL